MRELIGLFPVLRKRQIQKFEHGTVCLSVFLGVIFVSCLFGGFCCFLFVLWGREMLVFKSL